MGVGPSSLMENKPGSTNPIIEPDTDPTKSNTSPRFGANSASEMVVAHKDTVTTTWQRVVNCVSDPGNIHEGFDCTVPSGKSETYKVSGTTVFLLLLRAFPNQLAIDSTSPKSGVWLDLRNEFAKRTTISRHAKKGSANVNSMLMLKNSLAAWMALDGGYIWNKSLWVCSQNVMYTTTPNVVDRIYAIKRDR